MSGTSLDGIDVALVKTDGEDVVDRGPARTYPYDPEQRQALASALQEAFDLKVRDERLVQTCDDRTRFDGMARERR